MPIGEAGEIERFVLAILALDGDAAPLRIDPKHAGGVPVQPPRAAVVAGELNAVARAQVLLYLDERLGPRTISATAPSDGRPGDGLALWRGKRDRARILVRPTSFLLAAHYATDAVMSREHSWHAFRQSAPGREGFSPPWTVCQVCQTALKLVRKAFWLGCGCILHMLDIRPTGIGEDNE